MECTEIGHSAVLPNDGSPRAIGSGAVCDYLPAIVECPRKGVSSAKRPQVGKRALVMPRCRVRATIGDPSH